MIASDDRISGRASDPVEGRVGIVRLVGDEDAPESDNHVVFLGVGERLSTGAPLAWRPISGLEILRPVEIGDEPGLLRPPSQPVLRFGA